MTKALRSELKRPQNSHDKKSVTHDGWVYCRCDEAARIREILGCDELARPDGEWRRIETAPRDGTHILVGTFPEPHGSISRTTAHWFEGAWALSVNALGEYSDCGVKAPTHWMPLPEPPA